MSPKAPFLRCDRAAAGRETQRLNGQRGRNVDLRAAMAEESGRFDAGRCAGQDGPIAALPSWPRTAPSPTAIE